MLKNRSILINTPSTLFIRTVFYKNYVLKKIVGTINLFEMCLTITKLPMLSRCIYDCLISTLLLLQPYCDSSMHTC